MFAERIGHGYRVMNDSKAYERCLKERIHFEACPTSSILTGSVSIQDAMLHRHPILVSYMKSTALLKGLYTLPEFKHPNGTSLENTHPWNFNFQITATYVLMGIVSTNVCMMSPQQC